MEGHKNMIQEIEKYQIVQYVKLIFGSANPTLFWRRDFQVHISILYGLIFVTLNPASIPEYHPRSNVNSASQGASQHLGIICRDGAGLEPKALRARGHYPLHLALPYQIKTRQLILIESVLPGEQWSQSLDATRGLYHRKCRHKVRIWGPHYSCHDDGCVQYSTKCICIEMWYETSQ